MRYPWITLQLTLKSRILYSRIYIIIITPIIFIQIPFYSTNKKTALNLTQFLFTLIKIFFLLSLLFYQIYIFLFNFWYFLLMFIILFILIFYLKLLFFVLIILLNKIFLFYLFLIFYNILLNLLQLTLERSHLLKSQISLNSKIIILYSFLFLINFILSWRSF
jgi:hypothetical protein